MEISEKEFAVIQEISNNNLPDQRTIASKTGISLGLTNLIIQRLVRHGYLKVQQLNKKKIQYLLTPKGFAEKTKKSYNYTLKTVLLFKVVREKIQTLIADRHSKGAGRFVISGNSELADIANLAFNNLVNSNIKHERIRGHGVSDNDAVITIQFAKTKSEEVINLFSYLSNEGLFYK